MGETEDSAVDRLAISSCSLPEAPLESVLAAFSGIGYRHFELFTEWARSRVDWHDDPERLRALGRRFGISFCALHLPRIRSDRFNETLGEAVAAAHFAAAVGAQTVLFKATDIPAYTYAARPLLDALEPLGLTTVVTNHSGTAVERPEQVLQILDQAQDARLKTLLEVGHFHAVGVSWQEAVEALADTIAYVHIKDQIGTRSVPFGAGEIDLPGLFAGLRERGYEGQFVIEMENEDTENTLPYCRKALEYALPLL
jgi:inosose dehydratase